VAGDPGASVRVSIIIPAYNAEKYVGAAITSSLTQTYRDVEVVVVDDGSTDRTSSIAEGYGPLLTLVRQENRGLSAARNAGISAATGSVIVLCDSDDFLLPTHVEQAVSLLEGAPKTWVTSEAMLLPQGEFNPRRGVLWAGTVPPGKQLEVMTEGNFVSIFSTFPREMFDEVGGFDESLRTCEDWDLWLRALLAGWRVTFQTVPTALYRWAPTSMSTNDEAMAEGQRQVLSKALATFPEEFEPRLRRQLENRLVGPTANELSGRAEAALRRGDASEARALFRRASALRPRDRRLRAKAVSMRLVPGAGSYWRRRLLNADTETGRLWDPRTGEARRGS
jgi:glycosyltransferase involved in cell wall biosynthesis